MTPVEFHFVTPEGLPVANTEFEVQLAKSSFDAEDSGVLMPRPVVGTTDLEGKATLDLWSTGELYYVSVYDTESDAGLSYKFIVPELEVPGGTVRLQDIVLEGERSVTPWDDAALLVVLNAKANSMAAAAAAAQSALAAQTSAGSVITSIAALTQETQEQVLTLSLQVTASVTSLAASVTRMSTQLIQNELTA